MKRTLLLALALSTNSLSAQTTSTTPRLEPTEAAKTFTTPDDLVIEQVLCEPAVAQPLFTTFDERGRMWVVQYLQYPFPAGLKILSEDKFLRATYDKVPPPPPNHFVGADKITIHEDTNGDGTFDTQKTFVEGLNIVTSLAFGRGGVWVLNPPYLLFYPDRNHDDVPDGDPEVHLAGFGMEDTHSNASNLTWGPDGWLYGAQGSTVSGAIIRPGLDKTPVTSMGQLIWRYHPEQRRYEIFSEGGGNAFGVEIDSQGRVFSGHNGGDTRGFHYAQGAYLQKSFGKHGPLSNPFSFGYFPAMKHPNVPRFTHTFVVYDSGALPEKYHDKLFAVAPLHSIVWITEREVQGSTYQTRDVGQAVTTSDTWFRPVHISVGPDGALYVCDMYEGQIAHLRHHEGKIDKTSGRIYRVKAKGAEPIKPFDLSKLATSDLTKHLDHPNRWFRRTALRLLADRKDDAIVPVLAAQLKDATGQRALETLWALNACGACNDDLALAPPLDHANPLVRMWGVRLLGDKNQVTDPLAKRLAQLATSEANVEVRSQLASTARRLPAAKGLPIVRQLLTHEEDLDEQRLPLLLWWAIESTSDAARDAVLALFKDSPLWDLPIVKKHLLHRVMRRYAQAGTRKDLLTCAALLKLSPDEARSQLLMRGFEEAYQGRAIAGLPAELIEAMAKVGGKSIALGMRQGQAEAIGKALAIVADPKGDNNERLQYIQIFGEIREPRSVAVLLEVVKSGDDALRMAALTSLQPYNDAGIPAAVLPLYGKFNDDVRSVAQTLLVSRKPWALALAGAVEAGTIDPKTIPVDVVRKLTVHRDERLTSLIAKHWGTIDGATTGEMQQQIARFGGVIRDGAGSPYPGKKLFVATCAKCHKLHGQGGQIGPDLTAYKRDDLPNMLVNIVNPSAEVREGFETFQVITTDGRAISGFLVERDNQVVVLRGIDGQNIIVPHDQIDEMARDRKSLMPENQLRDLTDQQVRDLMAYLRSSQPLND